MCAGCELRAETEDQSYRDFLATLIAVGVAHRAQTRIERSVRKALLGSYLGPELVTEGRQDPSRDRHRLQNGYEARFTSAAEMIETLAVATRRGELAHTLAHYTHPPLLVIDEVGYLARGGDAANLMFQVVNERHLHRRPMLFTTNKPLAAWGLALHDPDLAEVILDRVLECGRLVELRGASYRARHLRRAEPPRSPGDEPISGNHRQDFQAAGQAVRSREQTCRNYPSPGSRASTAPAAAASCATTILPNPGKASCA